MAYHERLLLLRAILTKEKSMHNPLVELTGRILSDRCSNPDIREETAIYMRKTIESMSGAEAIKALRETFLEPSKDMGEI